MSIIFEGVDGAGKTTSANNIYKLYGDYHYIHNWAKPKHEIDISSEIIKEIILLQSPVRLLLDRSFIVSEYVYSNILGRKSIISFEHMKIFEFIANKYSHAIQLFTFNDKESLNYKAEDTWLPFDALNNLYLDLFKNKLKIDNLIIKYID